jgi:hypothetical protein
MMAKATWETKFGYWLMSAIGLFIAGVVIHAWQDSVPEDQAWLWSCHTMGNHRCGPHEPPIKIHMENLWGGEGN